LFVKRPEGTRFPHPPLSLRAPPVGRHHLRAAALRRSCVAAFHLEPLRFYLFGLLEKILRRLRGFIEIAFQHLQDDALLSFWKLDQSLRELLHAR